MSSTTEGRKGKQRGKESSRRKHKSSNLSQYGEKQRREKESARCGQKMAVGEEMHEAWKKHKDKEKGKAGKGEGLKSEHE